MRTIVLKLDLRVLNQAKAARLSAMVAEFPACVQFDLEQILILRTTDATKVNRSCYREVRQRSRLPASTVRQACDKVIAAQTNENHRISRAIVDIVAQASRSGEAMSGRKAVHRGNRNRASSNSGSRRLEVTEDATPHSDSRR
jgi:hypothetical protein